MHFKFLQLKCDWLQTLVLIPIVLADVQSRLRSADKNQQEAVNAA